MKVKEPLVSVVVPVYKTEPFLHQCLDSILTQSYARMEIILIDDGSPDKSGFICEEYAQKDSRVHVIRQENRGVSHARNVGIDRAVGQMVTFVDSDDWLEPDHVEALVHGIENCDGSICGYWIEEAETSIQRKTNGAEILSAEASMEQLLSPCGFLGSVCNKMFRTSLIREGNIRFREDVAYMEDLLFCAHYFSRCKMIFCIDRATYHYRQHDASAVGNMRASEEWLRGRMTAFDALKEVRTLCCSPAAGKLCDARVQTEYMEILLRLLKAQAMQDRRENLTHRVRTGIGMVLFSSLPAKIKTKYFLVALWPQLYCILSTGGKRRV